MQQTLSKDEFINLLKCPISGKIFKDPGLAEDGKVYELNEYYDKFPYETMVQVVPLKNFINSFLDNFPQYKKFQYHNQINMYDHSKYSERIKKLIENNNFNSLIKYNNFSLKLLERENILKLIEGAPENILLHFISNCINVNENYSKDGWSLLNYLCGRGCGKKIAIIRAVIDKGGDLDNQCPADGWTAMHQLISFSTDKNLIKYALDKNPNLSIQNSTKYSVMDTIFRICDNEIINYALNKLDSYREYTYNIDKIELFLQQNYILTGNEKKNILMSIKRRLDID